METIRPLRPTSSAAAIGGTSTRSEVLSGCITRPYFPRRHSMRLSVDCPKPALQVSAERERIHLNIEAIRNTSGSSTAGEGAFFGCGVRRFELSEAP